MSEINGDMFRSFAYDVPLLKSNTSARVSLQNVSHYHPIKPHQFLHQYFISPIQRTQELEAIQITMIIFALETTKHFIMKGF